MQATSIGSGTVVAARRSKPLGFVLRHGQDAPAQTPQFRARSVLVPGLFPPVRIDGSRCIDDGPRWRHWRESRDTHPACGQAAELTIVIDTEGCSKWTPADVPALIKHGCETASTALAGWSPVGEAVLCNGARR